MSRITHYLKEVQVELKKVNWPNRSQTTKYTIAVLFMSIAMAIFFGGLDYIFSLILNNYVF